MTDLSDNPDREELREAYESGDGVPAEYWRNFGDMNPAPHGGDWVHYDSGRWELRGTFPAADMGYPTDQYPDRDETEVQYVFMSEAGWADVVTEDGDWTDSMQSTVDSLHRSPDTPAAAIVDGRMTWLLGAFLDETRYDYSRADPVYTGDYGSILERVGVEPHPDDL